MSANAPLIVTPFDQLRVMLIDDDRAMLDLTEALLRAAGMGSVIKATSALGALNVLADHRKRTDCIVCDHGMPGTTGLELLRDIRAGKYDHIPRDARFVMVTAHGEEAVVKAAIGLDVSGYVMKPINKNSLTKAIHRAFNKTITLKSPGDYTEVPLPPQD